MDETLFAAIMHNDKYVLHYILPDRHNHSYSQVVQCCTLYDNAAHIANIKYRNLLAPNGEFGPL